jgi:hypothetical protein
MTAMLHTVLLAAFVALTADGCHREDPIASHPRIVANLKKLADLALKVRMGDSDGRFASTEQPIPAGEPWRQPTKANLPPWLPLVAAEDGLFHEQYDIDVDPTGIRGPEMRLLPLGKVEHDADSAPPPTRWCKVRAVGRLGRGPDLWEISLRIVANGEDVIQEPMKARRFPP